MPRQVGHYQILERVYETRWEDLYHACDNRNGKRVSLKIISSTLPAREQERLFVNERDALKALSHPNIVRFLEAGGEAGHFHIAVEPLDGVNLRTVIEEKRPMPLKQKLEITAQVADALDFAHKAGVLHRTLMPREIVLLNGGQVKLHGFHLRRVFDLPPGQHTPTQYFIAKLRYPAPEQVKGEAADHRADIFSLGAVLYELLCYMPPFGEPNIATVLMKIVAAAPEPLATYVPNPPAALVALLDKALAKKADDRYQTAGEMSKELRALAQSL
ncbi:MAG: serine/threonine protein kinase [Acidobacteria bacterium]|nr:serine/threonine protein kinase [Acidobacteriota bacterium]